MLGDMFRAVSMVRNMLEKFIETNVRLCAEWRQFKVGHIFIHRLTPKGIELSQVSD